MNTHIFLPISSIGCWSWCSAECVWAWSLMADMLLVRNSQRSHDRLKGSTSMLPSMSALWWRRSMDQWNSYRTMDILLIYMHEIYEFNFCFWEKNSWISVLIWHRILKSYDQFISLSPNLEIWGFSLISSDWILIYLFSKFGLTPLSF